MRPSTAAGLSTPAARQARALIAKDVRLHGQAFALTVAGCLLLLPTAVHVMPQGVGPRVSFVFNLNLFLTMLWSVRTAEQK